MKKSILALIALAACFTGTAAIKPADINKAVVNVITYDANGNVLQSGYGFLIGDRGEVIAPYQTFKGAVRAEIIDWKGQQAEVKRIAGASSAYDLIRFTTDIPLKKLVSLSPATVPAAKDAAVMLAYYTTDKKSMPENVSITAADEYNSHYYYETSAPNEDRYVGCPLLNAAGEAVALVQKNVQKDATTACAIDISFANELTVNAQSAFNADLNNVPIAKLLPADDEETAFSYTYMMLHSQIDSALVMTTCNDFIGLYPTNTKVLTERATYLAARGNYADADADLKRAVALAGENTSDCLYTQSMLMYNKMLATGEGTDPWPEWTLETALTAAEDAYSAMPQPVYLLQQGQILFSMQRFAEAYEKFMAVNASKIASAQTFFYASNALERNGGDGMQVIALLDSAVAHLKTPYNADAAPYLFARAQHLDNAGEHRRATADYNEYEKIVGPRNLTAYFYYLRMQSEMGSRMYQQALDDAHTAISLAKDDEEKADYLLEQALLQLRVNLLDECIATCNDIFALKEDMADAYKICGIAYGEKKNKTKMQQMLEKAKSLGAENTDELLEKYK